MSRTRDNTKLAFSSGMTLPNIPRVALDEKSRQKYHSEYDKYEPELRRHHLGAAETTKTIGLKDVPNDFDRTVPPPLGPTEAEVEQERAREKRKAQRQRKGAHAQGLPLSQIIQSQQVASMPRNSISPRPPQTAAEEAQSRGSLCAPSPSSASGNHATSVSTASGLPPVGEESAISIVVEADGSRTVAAEGGEAAQIHKPQPPTAKQKQKPATASTFMGQPRARTAPSWKAPASASGLGQRGGRSCSPLNWKTESKARSTSPPRTMILSSTPPTTPLKSPSMFRAHAPPTPESTARLLRVLLDPPQKYVSSLALDVSSFDLKWLRNGHGVPHQLVNIVSCFSDDAASPQSLINSPRSVITLLESGVLPGDWNPKDSAAPIATVSGFGGIEQEATSIQSEVSEHRRAHVQARRDALRRALQENYSSLCAQVPLSDLVNWYRRLREDDLMPDAALQSDESTLTAVAHQRSFRQRGGVDSSKLSTTQETTGQRKIHAGVEINEQRRNKIQAEQENRHSQQIRLGNYLAERQRREEEYQKQLQARLDKAEARNAERAAARERYLRKQQQQREAHEAERLRRLERTMAMQEEQAALLEQKRREKLARIEELRVMREARQEEEQRKLMDKQQRAAHLRDLAKQRALEAEEAVRQAALHRQQLVEERLRELQVRRQEEAAQKAAAETAYHEHLNEMRSQALTKEEMLRAAAEGKSRQNEEHHRSIRIRQLADVMWRREVHWEEEEAKAYAVLQLQRMREFKKLYTVAQLLEKRKAADAVVRQRELIHEEAMRAHEDFRPQRALWTDRTATFSLKTRR